MKRQYTKPIFQVIKHKNTGMQCNLINRKQKGKPFDVVEFKIKTLNDGLIQFNASPEEALEIAWGMIKTVWQFLNEFEPYRIFRSNKAEYKWTNKKIWWS